MQDDKFDYSDLSNIDIDLNEMYEK
jgi:hypothetical protein